MTVVDHPLRHLAELNLRIAREMGLHACWEADLLWGCYLTLDFGARNSLMGKNGPLDMGDYRMLLDEAAWWVTQSDKRLFDREDAIDDQDRRLIDVFVGKKICRLVLREALSVCFSDDITLTFERSPDAREQLLELRFPNGDFIDVLADGTIETESFTR